MFVLFFMFVFFFFQAEDGIRDIGVTGVQTCALPISSGSSCRATASWPQTESARTARSGPETRSGCWSSSVSFSEDVRAELAAIAPARECDRLAELSALFHFAGRLHLLGRGEVSLHLDLSSAAVARRAFTLLRELGVRSEI